MFINNIDPVALQFFSLEIKWYSLAYIFGILFGWLYCKKILAYDRKLLALFDDLITYIILGIIIGGRLGYILIYNLECSRICMDCNTHLCCRVEAQLNGPFG